MPVTPYHFGPNGAIGLLLRRWIDLPMFLLANVLIDVEVLLAAGHQDPHRHLHWHTLLIGGILGAAAGAALYLAAPLRRLLARLMHLARIPYRPTLASMTLGGLFGAAAHVLLDALYHSDVQPFWPHPDNPLNRLARINLHLTQPHIRTICLAFFPIAAILYAAVAWSFRRRRCKP